MTLDDRLTELQKQFDNFQIIGGDGVTVHGEMQRGYALAFDVDAGAQGEANPIAERGACCFDDGSCFDNVTVDDCLGTYQGDGTTCATFTCPVLGCTDSTADNFDPFATEDDGSCEYSFGACCYGNDCFIDTQANCETYGFYQGDDTECEPNPCPPPIGACCEPGGFCSEGTEDDCAGDYQGDDTICAGRECPTGCPTITMTCDSISASKSKCGTTNPADGKIYKTFTFGIHSIGSGHFSTASCVIDSFTTDGPLHTDVSWDVFRYTVRSYTETGGVCSHTEVNVCGGSSSYVGDNSVCLQCGDSGFCTYEDCTAYDVGAGPPNCAWAADEPCIFITLAAGCRAALCVYSNRGGTPQFDVVEYSDEYTTEELISHTEDSLPSYDGSYTGGACASSRYLSTDEHTYSIQRSKPKFSFSPVAFDFYVCYNEHFTPSGGGGGYDVPECVFVSAGSTEVFGPELFEPAENGTSAIRDIICLPA